MAKLDTQLILKSNGETLEFKNSSTYSQKYDFQLEVSDTDNFITMAEFDPTTKGQSTLSDPRFICICILKLKLFSICT